MVCTTRSVGALGATSSRAAKRTNDPVHWLLMRSCRAWVKSPPIQVTPVESVKIAQAPAPSRVLKIGLKADS